MNLKIRRASASFFFIVNFGQNWFAISEREYIAEQLYAELMGWTEL